jgi:hypothetical protein
MVSDLMILNVVGPYREPKEPAFSYDYSVQRPDWATPQGVRIKVAIEGELGTLKTAVLDVQGGTVGQQLRVNQILMRALADQKLALVDADGLLNERRDVMIGPFTDSLSHLAEPLAQWMNAEKEKLRQIIKEQIGI